MDMARLLIVMFGDEESKSKYIESRQLPNRQRLDDTTRRSVKVEYWVEVAKLYNDQDEKYMIDVEDDMVNMYLRAELKSVYRVSWSGAKLREQFRILRADYEGSVALRNYDKSGQNGENFYPDFQNQNPTHVMLHYLLRDMPHGGVLGDMPEDTTVDTTGVQDLTVEESVTPKRVHPRSRSPVSTSSLSSSAPRMDDATNVFTQACRSMIDQFRRDSRPKVDRALDSSDRSLRLVLTKKKLLIR